MWTILEIVINLYQSFLMIFFIKKRTADDRSISFLEVAAWFLTAVFLSLTGFGLLPVPDTLVFLFPFIYSLIASTKNGMPVLSGALYWHWFSSLPRV